jgi:signal transduction histidine kinase
MNSLRARLTWGVALAAVVPLALAMLMLGRQIRTTLGHDATRLLDAEISGLRDEIAADQARTTAKLRLVAGDAALKRLLLVRASSGRDLEDELAERRFLLGLDVLEVQDANGAVVAADSTESGGLVMRSSAPILYQGQAAGRLCGGVRMNSEFLARMRRGAALELAFTDSSGTALASTLGSSSDAAALNPQALDGPRPARVTLAGRSYLARGTLVGLGEAPGARLVALASTTSADAMIGALQLTSLLLALLALAVAVALSALWSSQVSRPIEEIAAFSSRLADGKWDDPLLVHGVREISTLVDSLDRMRDDLRRYRSRLLTSERQAAWGQMARQVAHEVKNPLTPIAISVADLKRSFEQQRPDFPAVLDQATRTVAAEIESLKRLLEEFSEFGRMTPPRLARFQVRELLADLETLYSRDVTEGRLALRAPATDLACTADAGQLRQALVNLIKNALEAIAPKGHAELAATAGGGTLEITVSDDGPGLSEEQRARLFTPGFSTKPGGAGLGLTVVERIVSDHDGVIHAEAAPSGGTLFRLRIPLEPRS